AARAQNPTRTHTPGTAAGSRTGRMRPGRIANTLLDSARQRPRMQTAVDLGEIADRVLALQRSALKKARIRATISIPHDLPAVSGDPQELQQVMLNAVVNAGARVVHGHQHVDDTGPGVPPEILDRVFEPF